jgi:hypothetical protein
MYCSDAGEYEGKRSDLLSEVLQALLRFTFVWGAFETLAKILAPPPVPKHVKPANKIVDRVSYQLRNSFDQHRTVPWGYSYWLQELKTAIRSEGWVQLKRHFALNACAGHSGMAISVVRHIRNRFAHGIVRLPEPEHLTGRRPNEPLIIDLSTRLTLVTMQMMLLSKHPSPRWDWKGIPDFDDMSLWSDSDWSILAVLHLQPSNESSLPLLDVLSG